MQKTNRKAPLRLIYDETIAATAEIYHEISKLNPTNITAFRRRMQRILGQEYFLRRISQAFKTYPTVPQVELPTQLEGDPPEAARVLQKLLAQRRSCRHYNGAALKAARQTKPVCPLNALINWPVFASQRRAI